MALSSLDFIPLASISYDEKNSKYLLSTGGEDSDHELDILDLIAVIPLEHEKGHVLLYLDNRETAAGTSNSTTEFTLNKARLSRLPTGFSKYIVDPQALFFKRNTTNKAKLSVIVSVKSGTCQAEAFYNGVVKELLSILGVSKDDYDLHLTDSERWISDFASTTLTKNANQGIEQSIIILSGDGGIIDLLNGLFAQPPSSGYAKPKIALLVLGTGNALANSSGLNKGNSKGLRSMLTGSPQRIPTFIAKFSPGSVLLVDEARKTEELHTDSSGNGVVHGAVVASWCLHSTLVADSDTTEYRKFGSERFSMAANQLLAPSDGSAPHVWKGKITTYYRSESGETTSKVWDRKEHMYILATLVSNLEAALTISPDSKPLDGQLRLVDFPSLPVQEVKQIFGMAFGGGRHVEHESVGYASIEGLRIDLEEPDAHWRRICIDGKIIRVPEGGWIEIRPESRDVADLIL